MSGSFCMRKFFAGFCLVALTLVTGCSSMSKDIPPAPQNVMPIAQIAKELPPYRIQVGDSLELKMLLNPELEEQVTVRPDGLISTAVAQNVPAFGLTPEELQKDLNDRYTSHLSNPNIAVIVKSFAPTRVYVLGEVNNPGEYISVGPNLTLLQALARAGGVKNTAKTGSVLITRRGSGEKPEVYLADYDEATSGYQPGADVRLAAYDVVFIPRTNIADVYVGYEQYIKQFLNTSVSASYQFGN